MKPLVKRILLSILLLFQLGIGVSCSASSNINIQPNSFGWKPKMLITAEYPNQTEPRYYYDNEYLFHQPASNATQYNSKQTYWLRAPIQTRKGRRTQTYILSFEHLTYVDLTLINEDGKIITQKKSGIFRSFEQIDSQDGRNYFIIDLQQNKTYTLLLRVKHIKGYRPTFDFYLTNQVDYLKSIQHRSLIHALMEGAIIILLLYISLAWIVSRYKPYIWIFGFLLGIGLYSFALQPLFIDIFFPHNPQLGWSITPLFRRLGTISFYILLIDFLQLRKMSPFFYRIAVVSIILFTSIAIFIFIYNYHYANYDRSNRINFAIGIFHIIYLSSLFITLWRKIDKINRFLPFGTIIFILGLIMILYSAIVFQENSLKYIPLITQIFVLFITTFLLVGIRLKIKNTELNYSRSIEQKVQERTIELNEANQALHQQQSELLDKNKYIETLIDELNHRVKNNLQLLYSLGSLHKQKNNLDTLSNRPIQAMQARIHAMMLVNQLLVHNQESKLKLNILVQESIDYLRKMYDPEATIKINLHLQADRWISTKASIPLALIMTELITNSYKHAFPLDFAVCPMISLFIYSDEANIFMEVKDNGVGTENEAISSSSGISLVKDLTRQIKGKISISHTQGFHYLFEFKKNI